MVNRLKEKETLYKRISNSVPGPGIEPGWVAPPVFETGASTDSAIRAMDFAKIMIVFVLCKTKNGRRVASRASPPCHYYMNFLSIKTLSLNIRGYRQQG